ncbi:hypothetical protein SADUNF_Sadunf17G0096700 [Salix dunnii]|uniref:Secreted protein n=1 Tax=Salix dunnii TaxID=1413687 RepID=A0A835J6C9_9ROSI|nr:hypothetical protein SADUNF_Sadunf17G0096700 [Salix dunnii]
MLKGCFLVVRVVFPLPPLKLMLATSAIEANACHAPIRNSKPGKSNDIRSMIADRNASQVGFSPSPRHVQSIDPGMANLKIRVMWNKLLLCKRVSFVSFKDRFHAAKNGEVRKNAQQSFM